MTHSVCKRFTTLRSALQAAEPQQPNTITVALLAYAQQAGLRAECMACSNPCTTNPSNKFMINNVCSAATLALAKPLLLRLICSQALQHHAWHKSWAAFCAGIQPVHLNTYTHAHQWLQTPTNLQPNAHKADCAGVPSTSNNWKHAHLHTDLHSCSVPPRLLSKEGPRTAACYSNTLDTSATQGHLQQRISCTASYILKYQHMIKDCSSQVRHKGWPVLQELAGNMCALQETRRNHAPPCTLPQLAEVCIAVLDECGHNIQKDQSSCTDHASPCTVLL
jgi:hypothetical protein